MKRNNKPFICKPIDIERLSMVNSLPKDLVEIILNLKRRKYSLFGDKDVHYTYDEYNLILLGAFFAYQNQELLGRKLPIDDKRVIEISEYLVKLGIAIQYHPHHGMVIVETQRN